MEPASDMRKLAFLGDLLPRPCGDATFTTIGFPPSGGNAFEPMLGPGRGREGSIKVKAGD